MVLSYSSSLLKAFHFKKRALNFDLWRHLANLGLLRSKPTRRGCRGGIRKARKIPCITGRVQSSICSPACTTSIADLAITSGYSFFQETSNLHTFSSGLLNIQSNICRYIEGFFGLAPVVTPVNNQATPENNFLIVDNLIPQAPVKPSKFSHVQRRQCKTNLTYINCNSDVPAVPKLLSTEHHQKPKIKIGHLNI